MKETQRFEVIQKLINKQITEEEARLMIGLKSVRQIRRLKKKVLKKGIQGLIHGNRNKQSPNKIDTKLKVKIIQIYKEKYHDFKPTFAAEKLLENHKIKISNEALRQILIKEKLWKPKSIRQLKERHVWRARRSNYGAMQQYDGSYHDWFEGRGEECCLLLAVDDASSAITKAKFDQHEGVIPTFNFWLEYEEENGFPCEIYLDKFGTYKINHKSAQDNSELITQFQRAMQQVGVKLITAYSPQAKGRVERMFETLQDRLVKEMRLKNICTIEEANKFLAEEFIPRFNQRFAVIPKEKADIHKKSNKELKAKLPQIFSIQNTRKVMNDYTIRFKNQYFQLEEKQPTTVIKKDTVIVEEHLDGSINLNLKGHYLKYQTLPERPKKVINIPVCALTNKKNRTNWKPPKDHIWRKFTISHKQKCAV